MKKEKVQRRNSTKNQVQVILIVVVVFQIKKSTVYLKVVYKIKFEENIKEKDEKGKVTKKLDFSKEVKIKIIYESEQSKNIKKIIQPMSKKSDQEDIEKELERWKIDTVDNKTKVITKK